MDSNTALAGGVLAIVFGAVAILTRSYSYEQARKSWRQFHFPVLPARFYEIPVAIGGAFLVLVGVGLVVAALILR